MLASASCFQVHPELLTKALIAAVEEAGGQLRLARLVGLEAQGGRVTGVRVADKESGEQDTLPAETVVLAMGEWVVEMGLLLIWSVGCQRCALWQSHGACGLAATKRGCGGMCFLETAPVVR